MAKENRKIFAHPTFINSQIQMMSPGDTQYVIPDVIGPNGHIDTEIFYKSDHPDILEINQEGKVTALKEGYGEILAFACGKLARIGIDVVDVPRGIIKFTGHRGVRQLAPENTLASFKLAANAQFDYIETDISITKDLQLVIYHDKGSVKRLLNSDNKINDLPLEEIKNLQFIGGHCVDKYPDEKVPTFKEYLDFMQTTQSAPMIELKDELLSSHKELLEQIRDMINLAGFENSARVTSASKENILSYKELDTHHELWYIVEEPFDDLDFLKDNQFNLSIRHDKADKEFCQKVIDEGLKVDLWVVNDKKKAKKYLDWPITSITSDIIIFNHPL